MRCLGLKLLAAVLAVGLLVGCDQGKAPPEKKPTAPPAKKTVDTKKVAAATVTLCGKCGQIKGSELCCKEGAVLCDKCQLVKGAPGCCAIKKGEDVVLCASCGQIKGSDVCCKADVANCEKCGLAKGSPGCCKIKKAG